MALEVNGKQIHELFIGMAEAYVELRGNDQIMGFPQPVLWGRTETDTIPLAMCANEGIAEILKKQLQEVLNKDMTIVI